MKRYVVLDKKVGDTPLMALQAWKAANPVYKDVPASYAGRLDPMAEGKLLILLGEECKRQKAYTGLDKEYEIEILLDVGSDTGDALGLVEYSGQETQIPARLNLAGIWENERGSHMRAYPQFSSKTVNGKPLFLHALEGTINDIEIPQHPEHIYAISLLESTVTNERALRARIDAFLAKVPKTDEPSKMLGADFRIDAVQASWNKAFDSMPKRNFAVLKLRVVCGTGAYMRSLAGRIGDELGTNALALSIKRTKIGKYWNGFWLKTY
jgi:tRNA U55 pseudouridine synthase TruB